jgi:hypothetical protein
LERTPNVVEDLSVRGISYQALHREFTRNASSSCDRRHEGPGRSWINYTNPSGFPVNFAPIASVYDEISAFIAEWVRKKNRHCRVGPHTACIPDSAMDDVGMRRVPLDATKAGV